MVAIALAALVFFRFPGRRVNQVLATFLLLEGINFVVDSLLRFAHGTWWTRGAGGLLVFTTLMLPAVYAWFVATAIHNRLTAPLRSVAGRAALLTYAAAALAWYIAVPREDPSKVAFVVVALAIYGLLLLASVYGTLAAVIQVRNDRPGSMRRQRSMSYLVAFASRDAGWVIIAGAGVTAVLLGGEEALGPLQPLLYAGFTLTEGVFVIALTVGLLRLQILDFDLKFQSTISRGTPAAVLLGAFLIVSSVAQNYFDQAYGWIWGGIATGLLLLAIQPLQRLGEKVARRTVGPARPTADLDLGQRREFYAEQVRLAWQDRRIGEKERSLLRNVRQRLRLTTAEAGRIELEITGG